MDACLPEVGRRLSLRPPRRATPGWWGRLSEIEVIGHAPGTDSHRHGRRWVAGAAEVVSGHGSTVRRVHPGGMVEDRSLLCPCPPASPVAAGGVCAAPHLSSDICTAVLMSSRCWPSKDRRHCSEPAQTRNLTTA